MARPLPTVIGPTENALRALLARILSTTRIKTYPAWVILNAVSEAGDAPSDGDWKRAVADALKIELSEVEGGIAQLCAAGLVGGEGSLTTLGTTELALARAAVSSATSRLVDGIGEEEQAIARDVLDHVRRKADELSRP